MPSVTRAKAAESSRENRRKALERRLLAATERLVSEGATFTELSVERLAAEAGISRSTFYVHFQDKGDLVKHLAATVLDELSEVSSGWWTTAETASRADLDRSVAAIVDVYRRHPATFTAVVETATYDPAVAEELQSRMATIIDTTRAAIERGKAAGVMRDVPSAETAAVLSWMVERAGYQLVRTADPATDPKIVAVLTDIIWTTLYR
jgi:TetR/AcrR family transcriptional regulator, ethionamide resistance regulator